MVAAPAFAAVGAPAAAVRPERAPAAAPAGRAARVPAPVRAARSALRERLGPEGLLAVDRRSGAVRVLGRLDGFLTGPSDRSAAAVALGYVRDHADVFGLDAGDLAALRRRPGHRDAAGVEHLVWAQTYRGLEAIDSSLRASVGAGGRLVGVTGGARPGLSVPSVDPQLPAERAHEIAAAGLARAAAVRSAGTGPSRRTEFANGDRAELAIFAGRLVWRVLVAASSTELYDVLVDARTGGVLRRVNRVRSASAASVFERRPGEATVPVDLAPYVTASPLRLEGPNAHAFVDRDDRVPGPAFDVFQPPAGDETTPSSGTDFEYPFTAFTPPGGAGNCPPFPCGWDLTASSWQQNADQAATQLFFLVNRFHDHLAAAPIGFTPASGNFEGADPVIAQAMDGAATGPGGVPDARHVNNANMLTLPDDALGRGGPSFGLMQMYLWDPRQAPPGSTFRAVDGDDDASIVYHEYTHGLNHRLVTDAQGFGALGAVQSGAIDEAQADWYSLDFLVDSLVAPDDPAARDVLVGDYPVAGSTGIRSQPLDCQLGDPATICPDAGGGAGPGGYTYGDFGRVAGAPEVHADGEIWGQTLWDLRRALGSSRVRELVTEAMRLVPPEPSFLDMRNAILQADTVTGGGDRAAIWGVFADRGMGYFASAVDAADPAPVEDFRKPPAPGGATATLSGSVRDPASGAGVSGARVAIAGHDTGLGEDFSALTAGDGRYAIGGIPVGTYPQVVVTATGYERAVERNVAVGGTRDVSLRRNFALADGGATVTADPPDNTQLGCGPGGLIDGTRDVVWGTDSPRNSPGPKEIVVRLPQAISLGEVRIDPTAGCGDDAGSALGPFELFASADGATYTQVGSGAFGPGDTGRDNPVPLSARPAGVRFVKLRALDTQSTAGSGELFMDVAELKVFAADLPPAPGGTTPPPPAAGGPSPPPAANGTEPQAPPPLAPGAIVPFPAPAELPRLRFLTRHATARPDGSFVWRLAGTPGARGRVAFTALPPRRARRRVRLRLGARRFTIPRSGRLRLVVRPSRGSLASLRRARSVRVRAAVRLPDLARSSTFVLRFRRR